MAKIRSVARSGGEPLFLDLGSVGEIAEVIVNGQTAGVLGWAPYQVQIGHLCRGAITVGGQGHQFDSDSTKDMPLHSAFLHVRPFQDISHSTEKPP